MLAARRLAAVSHVKGPARASEYDAITAVISMKNKSGAFITEFDDDLICFLHMQLRWVVERLPSYWLARYGGKNVCPRYENVAPLVSLLRIVAMEAHSSQRLPLSQPAAEPLP